jgi:MFS family permease
LLPIYPRTFGASSFGIGLLLASFSLCQFLSAPVLGIASDRLGRNGCR